MLMFDNIWYDSRKQTINGLFALPDGHPGSEGTAMFPRTMVKSVDGVFSRINKGLDISKLETCLGIKVGRVPPVLQCNKVCSESSN